MSDNTPENADSALSNESLMAQRFRGFLPVVIDVETGGFNPQTDALLEISAQIIDIDDKGILSPGTIVEFHLEPFAGANVEKSALDFTGIDIEDPERESIPEDLAIAELMQFVRKAVKAAGCIKAVLVGHNAHFDLSFLNQAVLRCDQKRNPFHPFTCFDTATLAALAYGQTVLAKACKFADIEFSNSAAHSAAYDTQKTAELFCKIANAWPFELWRTSE